MYKQSAFDNQICHEYSTIETKFLDVTVTKVDNKLETDLYCKPTDTHQYLHAQSCHRNLYKTSIAYGQAVRLKEFVQQKKTLITVSSN